MIRFIRNLIITLVVLAAVAYAAAYYYSDAILARCEEPLTRRLIGHFGPGKDDEYSYEARLHFWPPTVEVENLRIIAPALRLGGDIFLDCDLGVDRIVCDLVPLLRDRQVVMLEVAGRTFTGRLTLRALGDRLERTGGELSEVTVDEYNRMARVRGRFGSITPSIITVLGRWAVDDRGVITLVDRQYHNPDSPVPAGAVEIIENQTNLDVRITLLDEELIGEDVEFDSTGLWLSTHD